MNKTGMVAFGILMAVAATSCKNADNEFPDYDGGVTVYFANQYPARTVVLGEYPDGDNTLDNQHQVMIMATQSGAYSRKTSRSTWLWTPRWQPASLSPTEAP